MAGCYRNGWPNASGIPNLKDEKDELLTLKNECFEKQDYNRQRLNFYKSRITQAHGTKNYDTFEKDKANRQLYFEKVRETGKELSDTKERLKEVFDNLNSVKQIRDLLKKVHPDQQIENLFALVQKTDKEYGQKLYWQAVGISTRDVRKVLPDLKHERKVA